MKKTAISYGGTKEAALYFENVIPIFLFLDIVLEVEFKELMSLPQSSAMKLLIEKRMPFDNLLPNSMRIGGKDFDSYHDLNSDLLKVLGIGDGNENNLSSKTPMSEIINSNSVAVNSRVEKFLNLVNLGDVAHVTDENFVSAKGDTDIGVILSGLKLVDADAIPIEKLVEFRLDKNSVASLRALRLFCMTNYNGKSKAFIEDDLMHRIDEYENVAKKWKFQTMECGFTTLFTSKSLAGSFGGATISAISGMPIAASLTAVAGAVWEIGKVSLAISSKAFEGRAALKSNPVSYVSTLRKI